MKKENKWPFIQWFVSDWLADPEVSRCQPATRGIWFDWILSMHASDRSGQITGTREELARLGRCTDRHVDEALKDLTNTNAANVTERHGIVTVVNRRMKREYLQRKSARFRKQRQRRGAHVTPHSQSQIHIPEEEKQDRQFSQFAREKSAKLTKIDDKIDDKKASLERIAREIIANKTGWAYDNCNVQPGMFPWPKSLATVLAPFIGKVSESEAHAAWQEAVRRTHAAAVDNLVRHPASYVIQCWKEALETINESTENRAV